MTTRWARLRRLGLLAGLALGGALAAWRLRRGDGAGAALLWGGGGLVVGLCLAAVSALGIRLQRRDLPPP